jgi:hypothetical protein
MAGIAQQWIETSAAAYAMRETYAGLGKAGLITIIVVSLILIITLVWVFRETGRRD